MPNINALLFDKIYQSYYQSLLSVIKRTIHSPEVAEDVLQDAFVKIWIGLPKYDGKKGSMYTWMATICKHMAIDEVRSVSYQKHYLTDQLELHVIAIDSRKSFTFNPDTIDVIRQVKELAKPYSEVILLSFCEGYTHTEIVGLLEIPIGTVKTRIRNGLKQIRNLHT